MSNDAMELINRARSQARTDAVWNFVSKNLKILVRVFTVLCVAALLLICYKFYQKSCEEKFSAILHQSLINQQINEVEKARQQLKEVIDSKSAPSGVKAIASLRYAAFLIDEGKVEEAQKIYADVNDCRFCDEYTKDLGGLLLVRLWMANPNEMHKDDLAERILKIENHSDVLKNNIAEQRALLELFKNNPGESYKIYERIAQDKDASPAMKIKAENGMKMAISKGYKVEKAAAKEEKSEAKSEEKTAETAEKK